MDFIKENINKILITLIILVLIIGAAIGIGAYINNRTGVDKPR